MDFGKFSGADLRLFLQLIDLFKQEEQGLLDNIRNKPEKVVGPDAISVYWCGFYEKPFIQHVGALIGALGFEEIVKEIFESPKPIEAMSELIQEADVGLEEEMSEWNSEHWRIMEKALPAFLALLYSISMSLRSLLVYGCYLNDLITRVRVDRDRDALFSAVKIDTTTLGCPSVIAEVGRARLAGDKRFFYKLRNAIDGKLTKREQANFQKMRVIFQVLKETGAQRLTDTQLYELFVNQLGLYASDKVRGDVRKNLRKLASQYLKGATT